MGPSPSFSLPANLTLFGSGLHFVRFPANRDARDCEIRRCAVACSRSKFVLAIGICKYFFFVPGLLKGRLSPINVHSSLFFCEDLDILPGIVWVEKLEISLVRSVVRSVGYGYG